MQLSREPPTEQQNLHLGRRMPEEQRRLQSYVCLYPTASDLLLSYWLPPNEFELLQKSNNAILKCACATNARFAGIGVRL